MLTSFNVSNSSASYGIEGLSSWTVPPRRRTPTQRDATDYVFAGSMDVRNLAAGTRSVTVNYRSSSTSGTAKIKLARVTALPLDGASIGDLVITTAYPPQRPDRRGLQPDARRHGRPDALHLVGPLRLAPLGALSRLLDGDRQRHAHRRRHVELHGSRDRQPGHARHRRPGPVHHDTGGPLCHDLEPAGRTGRYSVQPDALRDRAARAPTVGPSPPGPSPRASASRAAESSAGRPAAPGRPTSPCG